MNLLQGVRVLDLTRLYPGPFCTLMMADMGAEVIKVESPGEGDYMRTMGPMAGPYSHYFANLNRNKKSISLNLKKASGRDIFLKLASGADVIVEGFRPGVVDSLGIGYKDVKEVKGDIIYCSISGYGQDGPYRDRAGHDINYIAVAGILGLTGREAERPTVPAVQIGDVGAGAQMALAAILASLFARLSGRGGRYLDVAMLDGLISWLPMPVADLCAGNVTGRGRMMLNGGLACYDVYQTADGQYMSLGALEPKFWQAFCQGAGRSDLTDKQYQPDQRALKKIVEEIFAGKTRAQWEEIYKKHDACCEAVLSLNEMREHPQVRVRSMIEGSGPSFPVKISGAGEQHAKPAPLLGEHTEELLAGLGFSENEIEGFEKAGVI